MYIMLKTMYVSMYTIFRQTECKLKTLNTEPEVNLNIDTQTTHEFLLKRCNDIGRKQQWGQL